MTGAADAVNALLEEASAHEYGATRLSLCEEAVRLADEHRDRVVGFDARMELIETAIFGGWPEKALVAFGWCCARCDEQPEKFPESCTLAGLFLMGFDLLWAYKWIVLQTPSFSQISRAQIESTFDDMTKRYTRHQYSLRPVWALRTRAAMAMGDGSEVAAPFFERWTHAPRDLYADCEACEHHFAVDYHLYRGDLERALDVARPLIAEELTCAEVPHITLSGLMMPLLRAGETERAAEFHRRSYPLCRDNRDFIREVAEHLDYLVATDDLDEALALFERHLPWALDSRVPARRLRFFLSAVTFLDRLATRGSELKLRLPGGFAYHRSDGIYDIARLSEWFRGEIRVLTEAFDRRNGNDRVSAQAERHLCGF